MSATSTPTGACDGWVPWSEADLALVAGELDSREWRSGLPSREESPTGLEPCAVELRRDEALLDGVAGAAHEVDLLVLGAIDPASLDSDRARVRYLTALDKVAALVAAKQAEALAAIAGDRSSGAYLDEVHREHEVAVARRTSRYAAGRAIETARALAVTFPAFQHALRAGAVSQGHCSVLVDRTRHVADAEALVAIGRLALPKARRLTVGEFAREVTALVARFDPDAATRVRRARAERRVWTRQLDDGMGYLGLTHDWSTIDAIAQVVTADAVAMREARRACLPAGAVEVDPLDVTPAQDPALDTLRADALAARLLGDLATSPVEPGQPDAAGSPAITWERSRADLTVQLVIDLDTLRREADHPVLLDGQPIPAELGRDLAGYARAWRRMVTDPVTGHLLDYGTTTYLPAPLRTFVLARDGHCRAPGCTTRSPRRLQMDHATPWPAGGSDPANTGALCTTCHQLKTDHHVTIADGRTDGSATWTTAWGQTITIPARRYLLGSDPDHPPGTPPTPHNDDDPPPF